MKFSLNTHTADQRTTTTTATALLGLALLFGSTTPAHADDNGEAGIVLATRQLTESSDDYSNRHGQLYVREVDGTIRIYAWGGVHCGQDPLPTDLVAQLAALEDNKKRLVIPQWKPGLGGQRCIKGFWTLAKKTLNLGIVP